MYKKILVSVLISILLITGTGCLNKSNKLALEFKEEYESLNEKENKSGKKHRPITIADDNPYIKVTPDEIVKKINNKETFYLYVGDSLCPWCRSVLEKSIEVAKKNKIDKIYYIDIWDNEGNEILRDKYELQNGEAVKVSDGTKAYETLLQKFSSVLSDYTLTNDASEKILVGEKRIYAPNYFYIKNGEAIKMITGYSQLQTDSREELTKEMLADEEKQFEELFNN